MPWAIERLSSPAELDALESLWLALHHHHQAVSRFDGFVTDDATSWQRRRARYAALLEGGDDALLLVARDEHGVAGYALARLVHELNDTFDTRPTYAELESLSVRPDVRSAGIGTALLDRLDELLAERGVVDMTVAVLTENTDALRFYRRRGLAPVETYMWRVANKR